MITPRWVTNRTQPIAYVDVRGYLLGVRRRAAHRGPRARHRRPRRPDLRRGDPADGAPDGPAPPRDRARAGADAGALEPLVRARHERRPARGAAAGRGPALETTCHDTAILTWCRFAACRSTTRCGGALSDVPVPYLGEASARQQAPPASASPAAWPGACGARGSPRGAAARRAGRRLRRRRGPRAPRRGGRLGRRAGGGLRGRRLAAGRGRGAAGALAGAAAGVGCRGGRGAAPVGGEMARLSSVRRAATSSRRACTSACVAGTASPTFDVERS